MTETELRKLEWAKCQEAKRQCIKRIKAGQAEDREMWRLRCSAEEGVRRMRENQRRASVSHDATHRSIFQSDLKHALGAYFSRFPDIQAWEGSPEEIIMFVNRQDILVDVQMRFIHEEDLSRVLKYAILSWNRWSFPRFEAVAPQILHF